MTVIAPSRVERAPGLGVKTDRIDAGKLARTPLSAIRLVLERGSIDRFARSAALTHYLGLTPSQYSSGELDHRGHILKCGPATLRGPLLQCTWAAVRPGGDAALHAVFMRLAPRRGRKRAIVAVARRLAIQLHRRWWAVQHPAEVPAGS